jgi:predicted DsbA family dithiol-disulfide isomerase
MRVDIWSDVVCPWCYVGKARLEKALSGFEHRDAVEVVFRSFELDPAAERTGRETNLQMISKKFGMPMARARQMEERVAGLALAEGLRYSLERPNGNTFDLHRVVHLARAGGLQAPVLDAIYQANFAEARQVFDSQVLTDVVTQAGLDAAEVAKVLDGDAYGDAVRSDEDLARQLRITGVPFVAVDMKIGVSGAQSTQTFTQALTQAWESTEA